MNKPPVNPKAFALEMLGHLPENATLGDLKYEFDLIAGLIESIQDEEEGRTYSHEEVREMARQCLSKYVGQDAPAAT
jgi:hypothetical protein